ncbi:hypothetical protein [Chryseobacterium sp. BIGb0232]|uniref:hypothetical protein n=1 Tax=Chryseobacterium sp. BIGb0232 TaxID=2940598 RepID=UPI000F4837EF|nr:hypothetical protein [Chryseobacterium sp. BIGb0232]MCS4303324.1 hypothetical protein [Chryseobacterium sp. BIGb0232]ROS11403.1 hypothetical protein EDF65_3813 [Chryseobacterium nakagawai]
MKKLSNKRIFGCLIFIFLFINCSKYDKDQISNIQKLSSTNKKYDVYLYTIESGMAFGSSVNALQIVKYKESPDFYNTDFFRVQNSRPFQIKWNNDTLTIKTISNIDRSLQKQPIRTEIQDYKGINIKNLVYTLNSTLGLSEFKFIDFYEKNGNLIFKKENDSLVFNEGNSQLSIDSSYIEIEYFKQNNKGLEFEAYKLIPEKKFDSKKIEKYQLLKAVEK